ncbi:hypothetical protein D3C81_1956380 [compost metagenome]
MTFVRDDGGGTTSAVGDRTDDMARPDRGPIFANGRNETHTFQALQRGPGAYPSGEKLRLPFGHRALDSRRRIDGAAVEIILGQL